MKFVVAVVHDYDAANLVRAMIDRGFRVTLLDSTGGFLRSGNTTLLCGVEPERIPELLRIIDQTCEERVETVRFSGESDFEEWYPPDSRTVIVGGANVFILDIDRFERV